MRSRHIRGWVGGFAIASLLALPAQAQLPDNTLAPHPENAGIDKSLTDQVGAGRGTVNTPNSSLFLIKRDPFRSIRRGRQIFQRKFQVQQGFGPLTGDGSGNIAADTTIGAGLVDSCAGCHGRPRGSAGAGGNVATRPDSRDAPHLFGVGLVEMLADEMTTTLRNIRAQAILDAQTNGSSVTRTLTAKNVTFGTITAHPDGSVFTGQVRGVDPDLRVKPFFAHGGSFSIREFAVGAFNAEMGLEAFDPDLLAASSGGVVTTPAGMVLDGTKDTFPAPPALSASHDTDGDGVVNEVDVALVDHMEVYLLNYFKPARHRVTTEVQQGFQRFMAIGCGDCHIPDLQISRDRRVADVETAYAASNNNFNNLFATVTGRFNTQNDGSGHPPLKLPQQQVFSVKNIFTDLKRHDLGPKFWERNFDGTLTKEFVTEPLWGVASTAPYGHDGRSINLHEVILRHGGEAQAARNFYAADTTQNRAVLTFLESLVLFPPDDTTSNLDLGNPSHPDFPQRGHGSINLTVLFNDPTDKE